MDSELHRTIDLEIAAQVCYQRAEGWMKSMNNIIDPEDENFRICKARRDEADQCRIDIRKHMTINDDSDEETMRSLAVRLVAELARRFARPEYVDCDQKVKSWPFPVQPSAPPFEPKTDEDVKTPA